MPDYYCHHYPTHINGSACNGCIGPVDWFGEVPQGFIKQHDAGAVGRQPEANALQASDKVK